MEPVLQCSSKIREICTYCPATAPFFLALFGTSRGFKHLIVSLLRWADTRGHIAGTCPSNRKVCNMYTEATQKSQHLHTHQNFAGTCCSDVSYEFQLVELHGTRRGDKITPKLILHIYKTISSDVGTATTYPWNMYPGATFSCVCTCCDFVPTTCPYYMSLLHVASVCTTQVFCRCNMSLQHDPSSLPTFKGQLLLLALRHDERFSKIAWLLTRLTNYAEMKYWIFYGIQETVHSVWRTELVSVSLGVHGWRSGESTLFHQCGLGSIPRLGVICGLSLLVLYSAPRVFSSGSPVSSLLKNQLHLTYFALFVNFSLQWPQLERLDTNKVPFLFPFCCYINSKLSLTF